MQRDVQKREPRKGSVKTHFISRKATGSFCAIPVCVYVCVGAWEGPFGRCTNTSVYPPNLSLLCDLKSMHCFN